MGLFSNPVFNKREAWGYVWVLLVRGMGWTTWVFTQVAVIKLSNNEVGCSQAGFEIGWNSTDGPLRAQTEEEADLFYGQLDGEIADEPLDCSGTITWMGKEMKPSTAIPYMNAVGLIISICTVRSTLPKTRTTQASVLTRSFHASLAPSFALASLAHRCPSSGP
jgi:hypothetical protein